MAVAEGMWRHREFALRRSEVVKAACLSRTPEKVGQFYPRGVFGLYV